MGIPLSAASASSSAPPMPDIAALAAGSALRSRVRISDGGEPTAELLEFGRLGDALIAPGAFGKSVKSFACTLLRELGCPIQGWDAGHGSAGEQEAERPRLRLPWKREGAMAR